MVLQRNSLPDQVQDSLDLVCGMEGKTYYRKKKNTTPPNEGIAEKK